MTIINLKDFYPWYTQNEYMEVSDEIAEELRANKRYEAAYRRRVTRNKACLFYTSGHNLLIFKLKFVKLILITSERIDIEHFALRCRVLRYIIPFIYHAVLNT